MNVENLVKPVAKQPKPVVKVVREPPVRKPIKVKKDAKKVPKKASKTSIAKNAPKYEFLPELTNAFCGLTFGQLFRGDAAEAKKEMYKLFSNLCTAKVRVAEEDRDR